MGYDSHRIIVFCGLLYIPPLCFCLFAYRFLSIAEKFMYIGRLRVNLFRCAHIPVARASVTSNICELSVVNIEQQGYFCFGFNIHRFLLFVS